MPSPLARVSGNPASKVANAEDLDRHRREIQVGLDQLDRGEVIDADELFRDLAAEDRALLTTKAAKAG